MQMFQRSSGKGGYGVLLNKEVKRDVFLIIGGQDFIGAWIIKQLLKENSVLGANRVVIFDLKEDNTTLNQVLTPSEISSIEREYGDITNAERVQKVVEKVNPTSILHLAEIKLHECKLDPIQGAKVNVVGTLNVFESARIQKEKFGVSPNVVYLSSVAVLGQPDDSSVPLSDSSSYNALTHYATFKQTNEGNARVYWHDHQIPSVGLRPCVIYGVGKETGSKSDPTEALKAAILEKEYKFDFNGKFCFNYVEDVARIFIQCARVRSLSGAHALNIKGDLISTSEWIEILSKVVPSSRGKITTTTETEIPFFVHFVQTGLEQLLKQPNIPTTSFFDAINRMAEIYVQLKEKH